MTHMFSSSALIASVIGGLICLLGIWILVLWNERRVRQRRTLFSQKLKARESLYEEFVNASAKLMRDFLEDEMVAADTLVSVIAIINRIRVTASMPVLKAAESALRVITTDYMENEILSLDEKVTHLRERALRGADPLSDFSRACRDELWELNSPVG